MIDSDYDLYLTHKCNWFCEYCVIDTHNLPYLSTETVLKNLEEIPNNARVKLFGGEPGMAQPELVHKVMQRLKEKNCSTFLSTNGLFLKRFPEYNNSFDEILYHCSETLEDPNFERYENFNNIKYQITVSDKDYVNLDNFLKYNNDLKFSIYSAQQGPITKDGNTLSRKYTIEIVKKYMKQINRDSLQNLFNVCNNEAEMLK